MHYEDIVGKSIALMMKSKDSRGADDWAVVKGVVSKRGRDLFFVWDGKPDGFPLPDDALERMKPTEPDTKDILLDADVYLSLTVGPKPDGAAGEGFIPTGIKWPE